MIAMMSFPITRLGIWLVAIFICVAWGYALKVCKMRFPDPALIQSYATIANTKGGIILMLLALWVFTLLVISSFCIWIIIRGEDPQNAVVVTLLGTLIGTAFGTVNGAFFKTMTGEDPKPPSTVVSKTETSVTTQAPPPA